MKKRVLVAGLGLLVVGAVAVSIAMRSRGQGGIAVETESVGRREVVETVTATGRIQPKTQVNISADVSAKITRLDVEEGEWVEKGAFLLELDRERYLAAVESAEASLSAAEAYAALARENMIKAGKDHDRTEQLHGQNLESQASLDSTYAASQVEKARHRSTLDQVEQARAALKQARDDLSKTSIYSPMSGTISQLNKEVGEIALGSQFQEDVIMVVSNLAGMEALVDVDENDIVSLAIGDVARIEVDALPATTFAGKVTEIANSAKVSGAGSADQKTEFEVKIAIDDPSAELRPGMTASAEITTDTREDALSVPIQAVAVRTLEQLGVAESEADSGQGAFTADEDGFVEVVWVVAEGSAHARQVSTGIQGETHIEIVDGLEEAEDVVVGSYRAISRDLRDGSAVRTGMPDAAPPRG